MSQNQEPTSKLDVKLKPNICYFGLAEIKNELKPFGILTEDRTRHFYILGKTGMGKSTLLQNMILQDIYNGNGVCFLDPHGDSAEYILSKIPDHRAEDVIYFNPADADYPFGFNMLEAQQNEEPYLLVSGMMAIFNRIWAGMWSARMEYILSNTLLALLETKGSTLLGVVRMLTDNDYREKIVANVKDPMVKNFWKKEFASFNDRYRQEAVSPVLNKIGQFFSTDLIRNILGQSQSTLDFRRIMDEKKILIVNLSKGRLGEDNANLLGSFLVTKLQLTAMSRVDIPENQRSEFYLYVDEFQNFTTDSFATILSEARKYKLNLILAHQYIAQLTETDNQKIKNAIFGNVGSIITFRVGSEDGEYLENEFKPIFTMEHLTSLNKTQTVIKMSIKGKSTSPFLANTLPPIFDDAEGDFNKLIGLSRHKYGVPKEIVKDKINSWIGGLIEQEDLLLDNGTIQLKKQQALEEIRQAKKENPKKKNKKKKIPFLAPTEEDRQENLQNKRPVNFNNVNNNNTNTQSQNQISNKNQQPKPTLPPSPNFLKTNSSSKTDHRSKLEALKLKPNQASQDNFSPKNKQIQNHTIHEEQGFVNENNIPVFGLDIDFTPPNLNKKPIQKGVGNVNSQDPHSFNSDNGDIFDVPR
jgi:hypothetical protein